ncbi:MAG: phosphatase PAP2 family protein [Chitinophagaceae bacterium]
MHNLITLILLISLQIFAYGQNENDTTTIAGSVPTKTSDNNSVKVTVYKLKPAVDIPLTAIGTGWSLYAFSKIYNKDKTPEEIILSLDKSDIPSFDRHGANVYHPDADKTGDLLFHSAMPLPILLMLDKKIRKDAGKIGLLYLEAMSVTGLLYSGTVYLNDRYRPYAYNPNVPMLKRTRGGAKNSFFAGHVSLVATSTFFMAKVLSDYHPDSKVKWLPFMLAGVATGTTGLMRYRGGQHFLSDIVTGVIVGTLSGILVPQAHKNKNIADRKISFTTSYNGDTPQFGVIYKFTK